MGKLLFIDSDDINGLSEALREALEKRGVRFNNVDTCTCTGGCGTSYTSHYGGCGGGGCGPFC